MWLASLSQNKELWTFHLTHKKRKFVQKYEFLPIALIK